MSTYRVERYRDTDTGRMRWAVLAPDSRCFYFPRQYGRRAAVRLCDRLTKEAI